MSLKFLSFSRRPGRAGYTILEGQTFAHEAELTHLMDVQRRITLYLRALFGQEFPIRPASAAEIKRRVGLRPYVEHQAMFLPDACVNHERLNGMEFYRAAAAHCAAHLVHMRPESFSARKLKPLPIALIGLIEDARVEALTMRRFSGLKNLWGRFHTATPKDSESAGDYLDRLARALLDEDYADPDPWIALGRERFAGAALENPGISWNIGLELAQAFAAKRLDFKAREAVLGARYRDDNYCLWDFNVTKRRWRFSFSYDTPNQIVKADKEMSGSVVQQVEDYTHAPDAQWDAGSISVVARKEHPEVPLYYPEWDYQTRQERPAWSAILEKAARHGNAAVVDGIAQAHRHIISQMRYLLDAMHPQGVLRIRRLIDGDEIDLNLALESLIDLKAGREPSPRVMMRNTRKSRDISVMVLLDLSESTNKLVAGHDHTVLDLTRQATALLAEAIQKVGDPFAIHGFCSNGRHEVAYYRLKDFGQPYDDNSKARLAGMTGQLSTRMGTAIRHATRHLKKQTSVKKLLLVITDGEPSDIDEHDPKYLRFDTKRAVGEAKNQGIIPYCISLDPCADQYVSRIFGLRNYMVVDHVQRLPDRLPLLYAAVTR